MPIKVYLIKKKLKSKSVGASPYHQGMGENTWWQLLTSLTAKARKDSKFIAKPHLIFLVDQVILSVFTWYNIANHLKLLHPTGGGGKVNPPLNYKQEILGTLLSIKQQSTIFHGPLSVLNHKMFHLLGFFFFISGKL